MKKTYVVNGAAHPGFGETTARMIIQNGSKVIGLYEKEDKDNAERLASEFDANMLDLVCIDYNRLSEVREKISLIDVEVDGFVNACFTYEMDDLNNFDYELAETIFRANYHAPMLIAVELKKKMKKVPSIVIVTST